MPNAKEPIVSIVFKKFNLFELLIYFDIRYYYIVLSQRHYQPSGVCLIGNNSDLLDPL